MPMVNVSETTLNKLKIIKTQEELKSLDATIRHIIPGSGEKMRTEVEIVKEYFIQMNKMVRSKLSENLQRGEPFPHGAFSLGMAHGMWWVIGGGDSLEFNRTLKKLEKNKEIQRLINAGNEIVRRHREVDEG